jgi:thioredoxin reductase (NADPH)
MEKVYDMIIIGGGPAGLTAAIYGGRANLDVLVIEKRDSGSLISAHKIDNYPGFPNGITGRELYQLKKEHALKYNVNIVEGTFLELDIFSEPKVVKTDVKNYHGRSIIIASGWPKNSLDKINGEKEFIGKGVSYCATCDGAFTKNLRVGLFGQGDEVAEEALFLTRYSKEIFIFTKGGNLNCSEELAEALSNYDNVKILTNIQIVEISGNDYVEEVTILEDGKEKKYPLDYTFLYLGTRSTKELFSGIAKIDPNGYIITGEDMKTEVDGVYAAGDVRSKIVRQVTTAVADGTIAALEAAKYIIKQKKER